MPVKILFNDYAVDVYDDAGVFLGGITRQRMLQRTVATYLVADALQCILHALGHKGVQVEEDKPKVARG
jgi:hypothetical protein